MERGDRAPLATFVAPELAGAGGEISLGTAAAHHALVRRLAAGDRVRLTDGRGHVATGAIASVGKRELVVAVYDLERVPPPPPLELLPPVADRDRMLWLAEKCTELGITAWRPVLFARSRSVSPRGEGERFADKVRARMIAALEQSAGAWLPVVHRELPLGAAIAAVETPVRYVLDRRGGRIDTTTLGGAALTFGPEGGIEPAEHALLQSAGWKAVAIAHATLRFETAGIAGTAILRARSLTAGSEE